MGQHILFWMLSLFVDSEIKYVVAFKGPKSANVRQSLPRDPNYLPIKAFLLQIAEPNRLAPFVCYVEH